MSEPMPVTLICDTREPDWSAHPWRLCVPPHVRIERATLETGDFALKGAETGAVVERKAVGDLLACIGPERERFERELARSRHLGRFIVVCEGSLESLLCRAHAGGEIHPHAVTGTLAAWQRRFCPIFLAGTPAFAADFAVRFLTQPFREAHELVRRVRAATGREHRREAGHE